MSLNVTLKEYHDYAMSRSEYGEGKAIDYPLFGLAGEVGEFANKWKKVYRDDKGLLTSKVRQELIDELGDCLWYVCALARDLGTDLNEVASINATKIEARRKTKTLHGSGDGREKINYSDAEWVEPNQYINNTVEH